MKRKGDKNEKESMENGKERKGRKCRRKEGEELRIQEKTGRKKIKGFTGKRE